MKATLYLLAILIIIFTTKYMVTKKVAPVSFAFWDKINIQEDLALSGYDTVSYFQNENPKKGNPEFSIVHNNAQWNFSSEENKNLFLSNPERYSPKYGGYCAEAVRIGFTTIIDPEYWLILDDKLYLFKGQKSKEVFERKINKGAVEKSNKHWSNYGKLNPFK